MVPQQPQGSAASSSSPDRAVARRSGGTETDLLQNALPRVLAAPGNPLGGFQEQIKFIHGGIGTIFLL